MPNPDYNKQVSPGYSKKGGARGWRPRKGGGMSAEHGKAQKDTLTGWPKPGPTWDTSLNAKAKFPVVKTHVVKYGLD